MVQLRMHKQHACECVHTHTHTHIRTYRVNEIHTQTLHSVIPC
jgi:hypothetical protein